MQVAIYALGIIALEAWLVKVGSATILQAVISSILIIVSYLIITQLTVL